MSTYCRNKDGFFISILLLGRGNLFKHRSWLHPSCGVLILGTLPIRAEMAVVGPE